MNIFKEHFGEALGIVGFSIFGLSRFLQGDWVAGLMGAIAISYIALLTDGNE